MNAAIRIVIALPAEAKPVVKHFALKRNHNEPAFPVYANKSIALIVSGVGKINSAAAVAHLNQCYPAKHACWINFGIAGHEQHLLGDVIVAHEVIDVGSDKHWYPPLMNLAFVETECVKTVDQPMLDYPDTSVYDMESAGFVASARRYTEVELVHCLKVISDNATYHAHKVNRQQLEMLCSKAVTHLESLIAYTSALSAQLVERLLPEIWLEQYFQHWHFTATQRNQLRQLLKRWWALDQSTQAWLPEFKYHSDARQLLKALEDYLNHLPVELKVVKA